MGISHGGPARSKMMSENHTRAKRKRTLSRTPGRRTNKGIAYRCSLNLRHCPITVLLSPLYATVIMNSEARYMRGDYAAHYADREKRVSPDVESVIWIAGSAHPAYYLFIFFALPASCGAIRYLTLPHCESQPPQAPYKQGDEVVSLHTPLH